MSDAPVGVIEGYYGPPWSFDDRTRCIDVVAEHGGNAYVWAPKSEPRHRDSWREPFTRDEISGFASLVTRSEQVMVSIGLTPGADATVDEVVAKLQPALDVGCRGITLCFDDLPELSAAEIHRTITNAVAERTGTTVWLVPTHYAGVHGSPYLTALFDGLRDDVLVMWTGEHVVNDSITASHARARVAAARGRRPLLWDNTPVNDAVMSPLLHLGPYTGRESTLRGELAGLLLNPMQSVTASLPTIVSALTWWKGGDPLRAWSETVDGLGLRVLAEATAFPGDPHWPGAEPPREWLSAVARLPDHEPYLQPWVDAARDGARVCLAAREVIDGLDAGATPSSLVGRFLPLVALGAWLRATVRTLGSGPRTRPVWTQDANGRFAPTDRSIVSTESIPERFVAIANAALAHRPHP